jgi:hypothetical protein
VLIHILRGNKNKWLVNVTTQMVISNIGAAINAYVIILQYNGISVLQIVIGATGSFLQTAFFSTSHYMLAHKY